MAENEPKPVNVINEDPKPRETVKKTEENQPDKELIYERGLKEGIELGKKLKKDEKQNEPPKEPEKKPKKSFWDNLGELE